jgi:acetolactate synthase-1/2/3 large subunit
MKKTGGQILVESLLASGVRYLFTLSGNHIMPIFDATIDSGLRLIHTRHEATTVHMANAWGRLKGKPGVAMVTAGPGHCNALSALYDAMMAESPVLLLSGCAPLQRLGQGAFQELDQVSMSTPVTKGAWMVQSSDQLMNDVAKAMELAVEGRPGPVYLSLPTDVIENPMDAPEKTPESEKMDPQNVRPENDEEILKQVLKALSGARRPIILAGPAMGRHQAWVEVQKLSKETGIPALHMESPRGINDPSLHFATNKITESDMVLLLGKKLDFTLRFGEPPYFASHCRFIQIEPDRDHIRENERVILNVWGDPVQEVRKMVSEAPKYSWQGSSWKAEVLKAQERLPETWPDIRKSIESPIHPLQVCKALRPFLEKKAVLVSDGGEFGQWIQSDLTARHYLINGPSGSIGSSIPMALGAKLACPDKPVFVTLGDGTFGFHGMEFDTALRYHLPIIAIVGNDARWNAEYQIQLRQYGPARTIGCELLPSRYDKLVNSLGGHGEFVEKPEDITPAIERSIISGLPACINIRIKGVEAPTFK